LLHIKSNKNKIKTTIENTITIVDPETSIFPSTVYLLYITYQVLEVFSLIVKEYVSITS
jgi:hypothetical protein